MDLDKGVIRNNKWKDGQYNGEKGQVKETLHRKLKTE
jgi:hypothetical protein